MAKESSMSDLGQAQDEESIEVRLTCWLPSLLNVNPRNQLLQPQLEDVAGLQHVSFARQAVALSDGKSIADVSWAKVSDFWATGWKKNHYGICKLCRYRSVAA